MAADFGDSSKYPAALVHDPIEQIFPDIFLVHGSARVGPGMRMNRNMIIARDGDTLTLIGPVRLSKTEEAKLEILGSVKHVIRIGYYHGIDDRYYVERYGAEFWCQAGSDHYAEPRPARLLAAAGVLPITGAELFLFTQTRFPEAAILIKAHGGLLITCDSLQHWTDWSYCTLLAKTVVRIFGFSLRTLIGTFWLKSMTPKDGSLKADFQRLLKLEFKYLIGAHGRLCRDRAREEVAAEVGRVFG
ncbi:MAG TPA: hypothetical protein VGK77_26955 [Candidatus Binatia bacterium]|jgi:hypothetical protein